MFFKKIKSAEYIELKAQLDTLKLDVKQLELELQLYVKKLKLSKGIKELKDQDNEKIKSGVLLPEEYDSQKKNY